MTPRSRILAGAIVAVALLIGAHDAMVPVRDQVTTRTALAGIVAYRSYGSQAIGHVVHCRFQPTCSKYGLESVKKYGAFRGGWRTFKRIVRCNPWSTKLGTIDPP